MKFTFQREEFLASFQIAATIAPNRSTKSILESVKLEITDSHATFLATDMEIAVRNGVEGIQVEVPGTILLPVARFVSFLRECRDAELSLEVDHDAIIVRGKSSQVRFQALNPDEFPEIVGFEETSFYRLPSARLKELIKRTVFATDVESTRYALGGVLLDFDDQLLTGVATDGRRLAQMEVAIEKEGEPGQQQTTTIVPTNNLQLMERSLPDGDVPVDVAPRQNDLLVRAGNIVIYSRLVDGRFPRWRDVFPERKSAIKINVNVGPLYSAIRQAAVVANTESRGIDFTFGDGSLVLSLTAADVGDSRIEMPIEYDGEPVTITLDFRYVMDFLKVLDAEKTIELEIEDDESAALCRTDDGYGYVIMPLSRDRR